LLGFALASFATVLAGMTLFAVSAAATDKYQYNVQIRPGGGTGAPNGRVLVNGLNGGLSHTVRVLRLGVQQYIQTGPSGTQSDVAAALVTGGDQVEVQQPTGVVLETYTIPEVSLAGTPGSPVVTGKAPDGSVVNARYRPTCYSEDPDVFPATPAGGAFSATYPRPMAAGGELNLTVYPGKGDQISFADHVPGETICMYGSEFFYPNMIGETPSPKPYQFNASEFRKSVATGARLVLRRAGAIVDEVTDPATASSLSLESAVRPTAGDVLEVYRPAAAPSPSAIYTIPSMTSIYDASNNLLAIDAPAALRLGASVGTVYSMGSTYRATLNTGSGRTIFDFGSPQGTQPPFGLASADFFQSSWVSPDTLRRFSVTATPGDLNPPALQLKLASKFKSKSSIKVTASSNELVSAKLTLTLPAKLKTPKSKKSKKAKAPRLIARKSVTLPAGATKVKLNLTKAGKKLFKSLRGKRYPTQTATVTLTATDSAGNVATTVKKTKLVIQ
jgi:hypothetical protein